MKKKYYLTKYGIIGIITGLCNGLFGSGGGTIAVPSMEMFLGVEEHKAHATAIAVILPLMLISAFCYIKNDYVDWNLTWQVSIGGIAGGYIGARLLQNIPSGILRKIFGGFMLIAAARMVLQVVIPILAGFVSGIVSGMGIGGGAILIPVLVFVLNVNQHTAQSINLIYFIPTAIIALIVHVKNKRIRLKIAASIILFGILGAVLGSYFAVSIPSGVLKRLFGVFLFAMGIHEIVRK